MALQCPWLRRPNSIELLSVQFYPHKFTGLTQSQSKAIHICLGNWKKKTTYILSERINW